MFLGWKQNVFFGQRIFNKNIQGKLDATGMYKNCDLYIHR